MAGRPGRILALVCTAAFMGVLDLAIVNVALPSIQRDLAVAQGSLQWVVTAYGLTFGGFLLLGGRLADLVGQRRLFVTGLGVFALASFACGLGSTLPWLVAARALQGLGAALTAPSGLSILTTTFPQGAPRNRALGVWGAVAGSGATAGVIAGGLLTSGPGWPWIFLVNVPIGLGLAVVALTIVPEGGGGTAPRGFDAAGAVTATAGLALLVYGVSRTIDHGWLDPATTIPLAAAAALVPAFVMIELQSRSPLVPLAFFRRPLAAANLLAVLLFGAFAPLSFLATLYLQQVLDYSPLRAGTAFLAMSLSSLAASAVTGARLVGRFGVARTLVAGFSLLALGLSLLGRVPVDGGYADLLPTFLLAGLGLGVCVVPVQVAAFTGVERREAGLASGLVGTSQQVGGVVGVAIIATVAAARTTSLLAGATSPASVPAALVEGFRGAAVAEAAIAATGALLALFLLNSGPTPVAAPRGSGPATDGRVVGVGDDRPEEISAGVRPTAGSMTSSPHHEGAMKIATAKGHEAWPMEQEGNRDGSENGGARGTSRRPGRSATEM